MSRDVSNCQHFLILSEFCNLKTDIYLHDLKIILCCIHSFICSFTFYKHFRSDSQDFLPEETGIHPRVIITQIPWAFGSLWSAVRFLANSYHNLQHSLVAPAGTNSWVSNGFLAVCPLQRLGDISRLKRGVVPDDFFPAAVYIPGVPPFPRHCGKCAPPLLYMTTYCQQV